MKNFISLLILLFCINSPVYSADPYNPNSGDTELDEYLIAIDKNINRRSKQKLSRFVDTVSEDFQIPAQKVEELFNHFDFNAPDVLMSVSVADVSGQPLKTISAVYYKNKDKGWKYVLHQMNVSKGSLFYKQIKEDVKKNQ